MKKWCEHFIKDDSGERLNEYWAYEKYEDLAEVTLVPKGWKFCPICGKPRPKD